MVSHTVEVASAFLAGPFLHWFYFVRGELDLQAANIARAHALTASLLICIKWQRDGLPVGQVAIETAALGAVYSVALFSSIVAYRLFWSPLCKVPGPVSMRISKLVHTWMLRDYRNQNYKVLHSLRSKYGDVIRTGE